MRKLVGRNKRIACEPLPSTAIKVSVKSGLALVANKSEMFGLRVIFGNEEYSPEDKVYIKADCINHPWSKEVFELDSQIFIMVPTDFVMLKEAKGNHNRPTPTSVPGPGVPYTP